PATVTPAAFRLDGIAARAAEVEAAEVRLTFENAAGTELMAAGVRDYFGNVRDEASATVARLPAAGDVILHEILYAPLADPDDGRPDQPEYVELRSLAAHPVTLRGLFWTDAPDETGAADTLRLVSGSAVLGAGAYAVLFADPEPSGDPAATSML